MNLPEGYHRGHSVPEAGAQNQGRVNVIENLEAEAASSNLGLKKSVESAATSIKKQNPQSSVELESTYINRDPETGIPKAMQHTVYKDGQVVCDVCILNQNQILPSSEKLRPPVNVIE